MFTALLVLQVLLGLSIIALVLLQQGKGADMGAAFGAGASGSVFGAGGGGSFFSRTTAVLAAAFFANSILLSSPLVLESHNPQATVTTSTPAIPATDVPPAAAEAEEEVVDLPPADLPEVDADTVETPADVPAAEAVAPETAGDKAAGDTPE
jgi:preprotein translocase subunit SecG